MALRMESVKVIPMHCDRCERMILDEAVVVARGRSAVHGCITGRAHVALTPMQIEELCEGDVLVTGMTNPEATPAIGRSCAVVTDRGGILCHAAIVARQYGKPCVVGTKTATKSITSGMTLRVCAYRGIIISET